MRQLSFSRWHVDVMKSTTKLSIQIPPRVKRVATHIIDKSIMVSPMNKVVIKILQGSVVTQIVLIKWANYRC